MKNSIFNSLLFICIALVCFGCSKDSTEEVVAVKKLSTLTFTDGTTTTTNSKGLRTTLSGLVVNWQTSDKIGVMNLSDGKTNSCFVYNSSVGTSTAVFKAASEADYLVPGSYVAYYPYQEGGRFSNSGYGSFSGGDYSSNRDLMISDQFKVTDDGIVTHDGYIPMYHQFTMIKMNVRVNSSLSGTFTLTGLNFGTSASVFASSAVINTSATVDYSFNLASIALSTSTTLTSTAKTFYILVHQNPTSSSTDYTFTVSAKYEGMTSPVSKSTTITGTHILAAGDLQIANLVLTANTANGSDWTVSTE